MKRILARILTLSIVIGPLLLAVACANTAEVEQSTNLPSTAASTPRAAECLLSSLVISPAGSIESYYYYYPGEVIYIQATIVNTGDVQARYPLTLAVDGEELETRFVVVEGGAARVESFNVKPTTVGEHLVSLNGIEGRFSVLNALPTPTPQPTPTRTPRPTRRATPTPAPTQPPLVASDLSARLASGSVYLTNNSNTTIMLTAYSITCGFLEGGCYNVPGGYSVPGGCSQQISYRTRSRTMSTQMEPGRGCGFAVGNCVDFVGASFTIMDMRTGYVLTVTYP